QFCKKLSKMTGKAYRLPSEAEWEYACRAGSTGNYAGELDAMGWFENNTGDRTHRVGEKQPNAFGLYDMHGNVWERCEDGWRDNSNGAGADGSAWLRGGDRSFRVVRGGSWINVRAGCRSAARYHVPPATRYNLIGFRVVISAWISKRFAL